MYTIILSLIFFSCLGWLIIEVWKVTRQDIKTRLDQLQDFAKNYLGWPILAAGLGVIIFFTLIYDDLTFTDNGRVDFIRTAVLTIGALGGGYGLVLAARRQSVLEKQTQQGQDQLFNDRLGRGVEMLGHDSMTIRVAGIKVLEDLALTTNNYDIIIEIIKKFLQTTARKHIAPDATDKRERYDVFAAAEALIEINHSQNIPSSFIDLDLDHFELIIHSRENYVISFSECTLKNVNFFLNLTGAAFTYSDLVYASFNGSNLTNAKFQHANLTKVNFMAADLENCKFDYVDCTLTKFESAHNLTHDSFSNSFYEASRQPKMPTEQIQAPSLRPYTWTAEKCRDISEAVSVCSSDYQEKVNQIPGEPLEDD